MGLISMLFRWSHSSKEKLFRLKRKIGKKRPERTNLHMLGCGMSAEGGLKLALIFAEIITFKY